MAKLDNRVALVTGAGRGIGRAIAISLAKEGAIVHITARTESELKEVGTAIKAAGGKPFAHQADLTESEVPHNLVDSVLSQSNTLDILVNNAGLGSSSNPKPLAEFDDDFWNLSLLLNLTVPYLLCKAALPSMREKQYGRIINVSSINGKVASFHGVAYAASKHGLLGVTRTLAMEVAKEGITVNAICPGPVRTLMNDKRIQYDAERRGVAVEDHETTLTPMGRRLEPEEIAPLAVYLASDDAKMVTGQAWNVDGGLVMF